MRLRDLEARFLSDPTLTGHKIVDGDLAAGASGVMFLCPKCWAANKGPVGTHSVICWFTGVPPTIFPGPGRWNPSGFGLDDLTFVGPGATSVLLTGGGCGWHGFVKNGDAT